MITENGGGTLHHTSFTHKARFYTSGIHLSQAKQVWICMHGYGHLATFFINKFGCISDRVSIIVPEGLHRFYLKDTNGRVGASWMTKQDRLMEIEDYCNYLDAILEEYSVKAPKAKLMLFGFSQGCATICRWLHNRKHDYQKMILWAGLVPEDLDWKRDSNGLKEDSILFVYGDQDQFIKEGQLDQYRKFLNAQSLEHISFKSFEGIHRVDKEVFRSIVKDFIE